MTVISVQSHVSSGHVGNAAADYPLRRMGFDFCPVHTALLAHHPGHGAFRGALVAPETVRAVLDGLAAHGVFATCEALLSGYLGSLETASALVDAWDAIRDESPDALFCCAPVIGDTVEGIYVAPDLPAFFRDALVPKAGVVIANAFEAGVLAGIDVTDSETAKRAATEIGRAGPAVVVITSVPLDGGAPPGRVGAWLGNVLVEGGNAWCVPVERCDIAAKGTGDFLSALWLGRYLAGLDSMSALVEALAYTQCAVERAHQRGLPELPVVEVTDQPDLPVGGFSPERI